MSVLSWLVKMPLKELKFLYWPLSALSTRPTTFSHQMYLLLLLWLSKTRPSKLGSHFGGVSVHPGGILCPQTSGSRPAKPQRPTHSVPPLHPGPTTPPNSAASWGPSVQTCKPVMGILTSGKQIQKFSKSPPKRIVIFHLSFCNINS